MKSLAALATLFTFSLVAQDFSSIEKSALEELAHLKIPGASLAIVGGGKIIFAKGFGVANVETNEPVRPEMLFRLGSTTKMFTAAALVELSVESKIDLNAPIGRYVNQLSPEIASLTANQLLSHTSGLRDTAVMYGSHDDAALGTEIRAWTGAWLFTKPGRVMSYSNPGFWLAGYITEVLTGKPYADAMEARLFRPLGMTRTTLRPTMALTWPLAQGHEMELGELTIARPAADNAANWPAGSIFSNTRDLSRFVIAFMNEGMLDGKQVLDSKVIALMSSGHALVPGGKQSYGYGLALHNYRGVKLVEHDGSRAGYGSSIRMIPAQRVAVIVQTNRTGSTLPATEEKVLELVGHLSEKDAPMERKTLPITAAEIPKIAGVYQNGDQRIEIVARGDRLYLKRGSGDVEFIRRGENTFTAGAEYTTIYGAGRMVEYLHSGMRSFARVN
jgi:CubicO group peptidase (beta-lactamase class C family)